MSHIQLPYGLVRNKKQLEFHFAKKYEECQYIKRLPYIHDKGPEYNNSILSKILSKIEMI